MSDLIRKTLAMSWKSIQVLSKDRGEMAILFLLPLLFASLLGFSAGGGGGGEGEEAAFQLDIYVVNLDAGEFGGLVVSALDQMPILNVGRLVSAEQADTLVGEGKRLAAIIIPEDFSQDIEAYERTAIDVVVDPVQGEWGSQVTGLANYAVAPPTVYGEVQYAIRSLVADSGLLEGVDPAVRQAFEAQVIGAIMTQIQEMESDPLITIEVPEEIVEEEEGAPFNVFSIVIPGFTVMFAFFLMGTVAETLHTEKEHGTFRRLLSAPMNKGSIIGGTMLAFMVIVFLQVVFLFGIAAAAYEMPLGNSIIGLLLITFALSLTSSSLGLLLGAATKNGKQAGSIGLVLGFVLAGLGGAIIQFRIYEAGGFLGFVGKLTPHAHALEGYARLIQDGLGAVDILPQFFILLLFSLVFFLAAMRFLKFD